MSLLPHLAPRRSGTFDPFPFDSSECIPLSDFLAGGAVFTQAKVDWRETPAAHVFKADVPGLRKEEVKVEIEDGRVLQISGERIAEKEERSDTWHKIERSSGKFVRRFRLPENAKVDQVKAAMDNGVLTVTVPKEEAGKPDVRSIQITG